MIDKKAGNPVGADKATLGTYLNTAIDPLAGLSGFGDVFYPGGTASKPQPLQLALFKSLPLIATYGGLAYLTRSLAYKSKIKEKTTADKARIASYINAEMPIVSPEPIRNPKVEEKEELMGTEKIAMDKQADTSGELVSALIPVVALVGGFTGGVALADKIYGRKEEEYSKNEVAKLKDRLDKLNYEKLKAVRSPMIPKTAGKNRAQAEEIVTKRESGTTPTGTVLALAGLVAFGTAAGSAYFAKNYFDERDPARERMKALEKALAAKASVESEQAPVVIPQIPEQFEKQLNQPEQAPASISPYTSVDAPARRKLPKLPSPSMDVSDPSMRQLIGG